MCPPRGWEKVDCVTTSASWKRHRRLAAAHRTYELKTRKLLCNGSFMDWEDKQNSFRKQKRKCDGYRMVIAMA